MGSSSSKQSLAKSDADATLVLAIKLLKLDNPASFSGSCDYNFLPPVETFSSPEVSVTHPLRWGSHYSCNRLCTFFQYSDQFFDQLIEFARGLDDICGVLGGIFIALDYLLYCGEDLRVVINEVFVIFNELTADFNELQVAINEGRIRCYAFDG